MSPPAIEAIHDLPQFVVSVDAGERLASGDPAWSELVERLWQTQVEFAAQEVKRSWIYQFFGWVSWLQKRRPRTTIYKTGSMVVAVTVTMGLSRPVVSRNVVGSLKQPSVAALIAQSPTPPAIEIRGKGRDRHGVLPAGATSSANGPRGRTIDDWDF